MNQNLSEFELNRLEALFEYKVLDTLPEKEFDDVVTLASSISGCEIALISLIDMDRQWFKAKIGLEARETKRNISFCTHAIQQAEVMEIEDATKDPLFMNNPLVTDSPHIRFYAGAPLINPEGYKLGTLCVIDSKPKKLTLAQINQLKALSRMIVSLLELRKANHKLENYQELLAETSKMSALGEMSAGLAHEINNPLTIISGKVNLALKKLEKEKFDRAPIQEDLKRVQECVQRISQISKGLRSYARNEQRDPDQNFPLAECVDTTLNFCREKLKNSRVELKLELDEDLLVSGHPGELSQVLLNLINNSFDAIKEHKSPWIDIKIFESEANTAQLRVRDSGNGIPKEIQEKLGTPFFTTKAPGEGTGLGLGISKRLMKANGGRVYYNPKSRQTEFIMELPCDKQSN